MSDSEIRQWLDNYVRLLGQGRYQEARRLLQDCRAAFEQAGDDAGATQALMALADLEARLNNRERATALSEEALGYAYRAGNADRCAIGHFDLANHTAQDGWMPQANLAHRLAAGIILFQTGSEMLPAMLQNLAAYWIGFAPGRPPLPDSFAALCVIVEEVEGVRFGELVEELGREGGADGDEAMHAVIGLARRMTQEMRG